MVKFRSSYLGHPIDLNEVCMEWVGIVVPGAVGALGGGGVVGLFRYLRESKEQTRREAGDIRAEIRSTYEKDIELANALDKD